MASEGSAIIRRALLSVFDKTGVAEFAKALVGMGVEIISSGGTAKTIADAGIPVQDVKELTDFPAMLGHRVVTLHPRVHGGILAIRDNPEHQADMEKYGIKPIDLVCVGLYPFEQAIAKPGCTLADAIEMIDIGGPAMVRAAAKNHRYVAIVTNPSQYKAVLDDMAANDGCTTQELRSKLALTAFQLTAGYDAVISSYLAVQMGVEFPDRFTFSVTKASDLRYGENAHQKAAFYVGSDVSEPCIARAKQLPGGKEISYNNLGDANSALELVKDMDVFGRPVVAVIKHDNPAGCAIDAYPVEAYRRAYIADANASMGGIIALNRPVTPEFALAVVESYKRWGRAAGAGGFFAEVIVAPSFDPEAVKIIRAREGWGGDVRLLETGPFTGKRNSEKFVKYIVGGLLVQSRDLLGLNEADWKVVTKKQPTPEQMDDLRFAWILAKHIKSNTIVLAKDRTLLGAGAGQMSRVNSAMLANHLAKQYGGGGVIDTKGCALASDAFFPFPDSLDWARDAGAAVVIEPGGSKKDVAVIARADELDLAMLFTGTRHFRH